MGLNIQPEIVLYFILGMALLYGLGWLLLVPGKKILRLLINSMLGAALMALVNWIGGYWDYSITLNPFVALLIGFLGMPGVALAAVLQWILK